MSNQTKLKNQIILNQVLKVNQSIAGLSSSKGIKLGSPVITQRSGIQITRKPQILQLRNRSKSLSVGLDRNSPTPQKSNKLVFQARKGLVNSRKVHLVQNQQIPKKKISRYSFYYKEL